jgi:hypothetical protein
MHVVGFAGLARGGKTTAARILFDWCKQHGMNPMLYSFAQPMKRAARRVGLDKDTNPELYRTTLQRWGESRRDPQYKPGITGPDYWVNRVLGELVGIQVREQEEYQRIDKLYWNREFKETVVIFDDMRYMNELELVKSLNGTTVFVDGSFRLKDDMGAAWRQHESERLATAYTTMSLPDETFDFYVRNAGSEAEFKELVENLAPAWIDVETLS